MKLQPVKTTWTLEFEHDGSIHTVPATVPGNVHLDLMNANLIPDPYFGDNVHQLVEWEQTNWCYRTSVSVPDGDGYQSVFLRFDGIDTIARIVIDGTEVATSKNMFLPVPVDVTAMSSKEISIEIFIDNVINHEWNRTRTAGAGTLPYNYESLYVRKARHSFGWDIAPRIVTAGIWRAVYFELHSTSEIEDIYIHTIDADEDLARVGIDWNVHIPIDSTDAQLHISIHNPLGVCVADELIKVRFPGGRHEVSIKKPSLWWPRGYGDASLYSMTAELNVNKSLADKKINSFGIRTIELLRSDAIESQHKDFRLIVNGEPIFARGSNWVPSDSFHSRAVSKALVNLKPYIDSECNILRIWGGGIYEDSTLFEACDREGIMIWQDFMLGCELPPNDDEYHRQIREEVGVVARRYRNHPSLALWCGDNENDAAYRQWHGNRYDRNLVSRTVIPDILATHDPYRAYLPSSPYISEAAWNESTANPERSILEIIPEHHLWGPRDAFKGDFYRRNTAVFVSEIGYHGCPAVSSIKKFLSPSSLDRSTSDGKKQWITHATQPYGDIDGRYAHRIKLMENQVSMFFGDVPEDLSSFSTASQISQAEAKKYFIEHFRLRKWKKSGIIWWNMQDMWPQFSDAVIDYYGKKKLAWYYIARSQNPFCIAIDEADAWKRDVYALNDTAGVIEGVYRISSNDGTVDIGDTEFSIAANTSSKIGEIPYTDTKHRVLLIDWEYGSNPNAPICGRNHYLCAEPPVAFDAYTDDWLPLIQVGESSWWEA